MARYKKNQDITQGMPGLFDDLESSLFPEVEPLPRVPEIDRDALKIARRSAPVPPKDLFGSDDTFSPLEDVAPIDRLNFISFGSGSSGNCAYIGDGESGFLIDAGVDCHKVELELKRNGIDMKSVKGIVLTHDHSHHVHYAYALVRGNRHMHVYCTPRALNGLLRRHSISNRIKDYHVPIYKEHPFKIGNFTVLAFEVSHDGTDNSGFYITHGRHTLTVATDLGCVTERVDHYMRLANYIMIEANYDERMLAAGPYPEYLKARIRSDSGHLDNKVTAAYLAEIYSERLRNIFLCHLSKDNNNPETALKTIEDALLATGIPSVGDGSGTPYARMAPVQLMALPRFDSTGLITLRLS